MSQSEEPPTEAPEVGQMWSDGRGRILTITGVSVKNTIGRDVLGIVSFDQFDSRTTWLRKTSDYACSFQVFELVWRERLA